MKKKSKFLVACLSLFMLMGTVDNSSKGVNTNIDVETKNASNLVKTGGVAVPGIGNQPVITNPGIKSVSILADKTVIDINEEVYAVASVRTLAVFKGTLNYVWSSSDTSVMTVNGNGEFAYFKGVSCGSAELICKVNGNYIAKIHITVKHDVPVESISIVTPNGTDSFIGSDEMNFKALVTPENATDVDIEWTSSNPNILSFESNGREVVANANGCGYVTITATNHGKNRDISKSLEVYVVGGELIEEENVVLNIYESCQLTIQPFKYNKVYYSVSFLDGSKRNSEGFQASECLSITNKGFITANYFGQFVITAQYSEFRNGEDLTIVDKCYVTVNELSLVNKDELPSKFFLNSTFTPKFAYNGVQVSSFKESIEFECSKNECISFVGDGRIVFNKASNDPVYITFFMKNNRSAHYTLIIDKIYNGNGVSGKQWLDKDGNVKSSLTMGTPMLDRILADENNPDSKGGYFNSVIDKTLAGQYVDVYQSPIIYDTNGEFLLKIETKREGTLHVDVKSENVNEIFKDHDSQTNFAKLYTPYGHLLGAVEITSMSCGNMHDYGDFHLGKGTYYLNIKNTVYHYSTDGTHSANSMNVGDWVYSLTFEEEQDEHYIYNNINYRDGSVDDNSMYIWVNDTKFEQLFSPQKNYFSQEYEYAMDSVGLCGNTTPSYCYPTTSLYLLNSDDEQLKALYKVFEEMASETNKVVLALKEDRNSQEARTLLIEWGMKALNIIKGFKGETLLKGAVGSLVIALLKNVAKSFLSSINEELLKDCDLNDEELMENKISIFLSMEIKKFVSDMSLLIENFEEFYQLCTDVKCHLAGIIDCLQNDPSIIHDSTVKVSYKLDFGYVIEKSDKLYQYRLVFLNDYTDMNSLCEDNPYPEYENYIRSIYSNSSIYITEDCIDYEQLRCTKTCRGKDTLTGHFISCDSISVNDFLNKSYCLFYY